MNVISTQFFFVVICCADLLVDLDMRLLELKSIIVFGRPTYLPHEV